MTRDEWIQNFDRRLEYLRDQIRKQRRLAEEDQHGLPEAQAATLQFVEKLEAWAQETEKGLRLLEGLD